MAVFDGLPATIRIGAYDWNIEFHNGITDESGEELAGQCIERSYVIQLNTCEDIHPFPLVAVETVIHEIGHTIFSSMHLQKGDSEERVCLMFGCAWTQILRDNPELTKWIMESLHQ